MSAFTKDQINQMIDERVRKLLNDVLARADEAVNGALPPAGEAPQPLSQPEKPQSLDMFPPVTREYIKNVSMTPDGKTYLVKLQFIGGDKYKEVADAMKAAKGTFISAGKESHWRVPV
jgi:hypothetical protein